MIYFEETIFDAQEEDKICFACNKDIENSSKYKNFKICSESSCNFHFLISAKERINLIIDSGSFKEINKNLNTQTTRNNQVKKQWENTTQTTLTGIVRPFLLDSGSELLATKVIITDPNGNDIKTNFFKLANEAGLNNIDIVTDFSEFVSEPWPEGKNLNPFDAITDYYQYDAERSSHQDAPEHEIVYVNEQNNLGRDIPYEFEQAGIALSLIHI